jgi:hypothetical protein
VFKKGMYTLINDGIKKCLITVVLNVQNFGKCLSVNVSSVAGLIEKENMLQNTGGFCSSEIWAVYVRDKFTNTIHLILTLSIFYCSIRNNWIGHKFHNLETSSPIHT